MDTKFSKLGVETKFNKFGEDINPSIEEIYPAEPNPAVVEANRVSRNAVLTMFTKLGVETRFSRLGEETKFRRFAVET